MTPRNCAVVTLRSGVEARFLDCDADEYRIGELTVTDRQTFKESIFSAGSWSSVTVYDARGHYLYIIDKHPQAVRFIGMAHPPAA